MRGRWLHRPPLLGAFALLMGTQCVFAQTFVRNADQTTAQRPAESQVFAIMGQVARPGVYQLRERSVTLHQLVDYAGGLTQKAQGRVRLIRGDRAGQQTWYTPNSRFELFSGDMVIIDSAFEAQRGFSGNHDNQFVQIGLVNLLQYPVVVKLRREIATAPGIVAVLGQAPETAAMIRVISTTRFNDLRGRSNQPGQLLPSGTVLIFNPRTIDYSRVPNLPVPFTAEALAAERRNGLRAPNPIAVLPRDKRQQPRPMGPLAEREIDPPAVPGRAHIATPSTPPPNLKTPPSARPINEDSSLLMDSFEDDEADAIPSNETDSPSSTAADQLTAQDNEVSATVSGEAIIAPPKPHAPHWAILVEEGQKFVDWPAISIAIVVVCTLVLAGIVLWPMVRVEPPRPPREPMPQEYLNAIIGNHMAVLEEPIPLSKIQEFYGTPATTGQFRVDAKVVATNEVPKPHFRPNVTSKEPVLAGQFTETTPTVNSQMGTSVVSADETANRTQPQPQPQPTRHSIEVPQSDIIDRALRTVQGD